ncbi:MAG: hypothetical protein AABY86_04575 [Bdellovibrionota bacterium]
MGTHILARISESRFCPNKIFYYHTILGLEFRSLNEKCLLRKPMDIIFEKVDQRSLSQKQLDFVLDELLAVSGSDSVPGQREIFDVFFKLGDTCFLARKNDVLIGYYWAFRTHHIITYDDYKSKNLEIELASNMIFFGNGFIHPSFRLKGVFPHFAKYCIQQFSCDSRFITATDIENNLSLNSHNRLGYLQQFQLTCISLWRLHLHFIKAKQHRPVIRFHFHRARKSMPKINASMLLSDQASLAELSHA